MFVWVQFIDYPRLKLYKKGIGLANPLK